ncbi:MAG TPA: TetR/AcrR family transcriptional regulator [Euzebyales bacterium]
MDTRSAGTTSRRRRARLSRGRIVEAAGAVVRSEGIDALSMRRVARELGCSPMALYRHVTDRDDLLRCLLDEIAPTLRRPSRSEDPRRTVIRVMTMTHDWLVDNAWVIDLLPMHRMGWSVAWVTDDVVAAFLAAGLSPAAAARAHEVVWHHLVGEVTARHSRAWSPPPAPDRADGGTDGAHDRWADDLSIQTTTAQTHDQFLHGLSALLDGLLPDGSGMSHRA